ncbi:MAG: 50S ribosomal protein L9 [Candidatus Methylacidiphilales bacterium]
MPVEIILKERVQGLGAEADIVRVKAGYARNFLIPRKLAAPATAAGKKEIESLRKRRADREASELQSNQALAAALNKVTITFQMEAAEGSSKLFGSVTAQDIVERLATLGHTVERKKINLPQPLKELGESKIEVNFGMDIKASFKVVLERAQSEEPAAREEEEEAPKRKPRKR